MSDVVDLSSCVAAEKRAERCAGIFTLPLSDTRPREGIGDLAGAGAGGSLDFHDHRLYAPGDDPRHINWQAYARTGDYSLKLYREEIRPVVEIVLDATPSMFHEPEKRDRALDLFQFVLAAAERAGAARRVHIADAERARRVDPERVAGHRWIDLVASNSPPHAVPRVESASFRPGSLRVWISDLLFPADPAPLLRPFGRDGGRGIIFCPHTAAESDPEWRGNYRFVEVESRESRSVRIDANRLSAYREAYHHHFDLWKDSALRHRVTLARVAAETPLDRALMAEAVPAGAVVPR